MRNFPCIVLGFSLLATAALAEPKCLRETKPPASQPERAAAALLASENIDEQEIFVRLIFSETLAANCAKEVEGISQGIAWVLRNRTADPEQFGRGARLVTAPKQFRSSLGTYDVARRPAFLCPSSAGEDWRARWQKAESAWSATSGPGRNPIPGVFNYYLPRHFASSRLKARIARPAWAKSPSERVGLPGLDAASPCLELWRRRG